MFGWFAAIIGAVLFYASLTRTIQANPDVRIPYYRNAPTIPAGSVAMRSIGAGLLVVGGAALTTQFGTWIVTGVVGVPLVALAVITVHNHRVITKAPR